MGLCKEDDIQKFDMKPQYGVNLCSLKRESLLNLAPKGWLTFHTIIFLSIYTVTHCNIVTVSE